MPRAIASFFRPPSGTPTPDSFRYVFAALSGAALSFSFTGLYLSVYSYVCLGILLIVLFGARPKVAFLCGGLHMLFFIVTCIPWIATTLAVHGGVPKIGGWGIVLLIGLFFGLMTGCFAWCVNRLAQSSVALACIGAPFLWVSVEFVREHFPEISFPWGLLGYPASNNPALLQITTLTGIYGLSFLAAAVNAIFAWCDAAIDNSVRRRVTVLVATIALLLAVNFIGPRFVPVSHANHTARAVQLNFPEVQEYPATWFQNHSADLNDIEQLSLEPSPPSATGAVPNPDLLIWPEAPAPFSFQDAQYLKRASALAAKFGHPFLSGSIEWRPLPGDSGPIVRHIVVPYNSAVLVDAQGRNVFTYDKIHLVPFGEYEPFPLIHRVVKSVSSEIGGFAKGNKFAVAQLPGGYTFSTFICYEAIYPGEVRRFAANGAEMFVNISNDGWFGQSAAAEQHLRIARVRAAENRRWMLRVTNSGITASIDPYGRIFSPVPSDVRAAVDLPYDFRTDETIYTRYGDWFAWLCIIVSAILLAITFRKGNIAGEGIAIPIGLEPELVGPVATA
jgi:apolipoprotein N-acyltransferase